MYVFFCKKGVEDASDNDFCCSLAVRALPRVFHHVTRNSNKKVKQPILVLIIEFPSKSNTLSFYPKKGEVDTFEAPAGNWGVV